MLSTVEKKGAQNIIISREKTSREITPRVKNPRGLRELIVLSTVEKKGAQNIIISRVGGDSQLLLRVHKYRLTWQFVVCYGFDRRL